MNVTTGKRVVLIYPIAVLVMLAFSSIGHTYAETGQPAGTPFYFVAIHNEPYHFPAGRQELERAYVVLQRMVERANEHDIRLTLMFTAQWADYMAEHPDRMAAVESWKRQGHEIAAHHHSIYHGNWDGYTDYSKDEAEAQRMRQGKIPEPYLGTLADYIERLKKINPTIRSGCLNDEQDKRELPDEILYDTCSGFANYGEPGRTVGDATTPEKGRNEYVTVGMWNNIERKWLAHYQITTYQRQELASASFDSMDSGVYGAVTHSAQDQAEAYYRFLEFLHSKDLTGEKSRTLSEIVEQELLPERTVPDELLVTELALPMLISAVALTVTILTLHRKRSRTPARLCAISMLCYH